MSDIERLARSLHQRNLIDADIAKIVGRPALPGHVGEFIAAEVFGIDLHDSASKAASDGVFREPPLAGRTVNVKLYGKLEGMLDLPAPGKAMADYTLVLTGPSSAAGSSKGTSRPLVITAVYLFSTVELVANLQAKGLKIGVATSVKKSLWQAAEIYPRTGQLVLDDHQRELLALFSPASQLP